MALQVFQNAARNKLKTNTKAIIDWKTEDVIKWLKQIDFTDITQNVQNTSLDGQKLLTLSEERIASGLDLGNTIVPQLV